ncbi:MAG: response regulator [Deferribacteraceae bacterium]|jgi:putative two-component system response regulator|nr:response regulator [Deferribacteraceae bacterium]
MHDINIVSVDDNIVNLLLIEAFAKDLKMNVHSFTSAMEALTYVSCNPVDIILTDYMMPEMHGIDFIKNVRQYHPDLPIVMITAVSDNNQLLLDALEAGAMEFLNKPLNPAEIKARLTSLAKLCKSQLLLKDKALLLEEEVRKSVCVIEEREHEAISVLGNAAEYKDPNTGTHITRVASYSVVIMRGFGKNIQEQNIIFHSAPLHDIGKIGIPDSILTKPASYTPEEFEIMKRHSQIGYDMLKDAKSPYLRQGGEIALTHHEKFNGAGYPNGLKGLEIPLYGRIVAIADVFDALTTSRPYKEAWSIEKSISYLKNEKGSHFDPDIVDVFVENIQEIKRILNGEMITL